MRLDIRDATRRAAAAEIEHNHTRVTLVSAGYADELVAGWSDPVRLRAEVGSDGLLEIIVQKIEAPA